MTEDNNKRIEPSAIIAPGPTYEDLEQRIRELEQHQDQDTDKPGFFGRISRAVFGSKRSKKERFSITDKWLEYSIDRPIKGQEHLPGWVLSTGGRWVLGVFAIAISIGWFLIML